MKKLMALFLLLLPYATASAATYFYTGPNYGTILSAVYATSLKPTGSFTTAAPLPPNMPLKNIGPGGSNLVTSWDFSDGVAASYTQANSTISLNVQTDGSGDISGFVIGLDSPQAPLAAGQPLSRLTLGTNAATALTGLNCAAVAPDGTCQLASAEAETGGAIANGPGRFAVSTSPPPRSPDVVASTPAGSPLIPFTLTLSIMTLSVFGAVRRC